MLTGVAIFLLVLIALLAIPVSLTYRLSWRRALRGDIKLQWLFGLVHIQLPMFQTESAASQRKSLTDVNRDKKSSGKKSSPIAAFRQKSFRQRIFRFVLDLWHAIHKHDIRMRVRIGLGDPAETGRLWAVVGPVSGMLASLQDTSIEIEPEFIDSVFELDSSGNIRIIPLHMVYLTIGLCLSPSIWQGIKQMRKAES